MTQWLDSESDLHFLCSDAGFLAEKPASLKHKYGIQLFLCSDTSILARKPASLQGNFKVPKNMDFLGDFAQFRRASSTQRARTACFVPTSDRNAGKVSEVSRKTQGPQTELLELLGKRRRFRNASIHLPSQQPGMLNLGPRQSASQCIYDGFAWLKVDQQLTLGHTSVPLSGLGGQ